MKITFISGDCSQKTREICYRYLAEKYRREKLQADDRNIRKGQYGRTSQEWIQPPGSTEGMQEESRDK